MSQSINGLVIAPEPYIFPPSFQKESDINNPAPSQLFVFLDVHEAGILDSLFGIPPPGWHQIFRMPEIWWDLPADRHSQGCNFSFADGHAEHWRWTVPKLFEHLRKQIGESRSPKPTVQRKSAYYFTTAIGASRITLVRMLRGPCA